MNKCMFCSKEINNRGSLVVHERQCKENPNRVPIKKIGSSNAGAKKGCIPYNKGLAMSEEQKLKISKSMTDNPLVLGKGSTPEKEAERIKKITEYAKENNGGYRQGSGRGKKGWYKGIFCDSSWELAFVIYHKDRNLDIQRCKEIRQYIFKDEVKNYYPDFKVDSKIYEIKGYETEQSKATQEYNKDIIVLNKTDMKLYLDYAIDKYSKDFISLYEKS